MCTGSGKSRVSIMALKELKSKTIALIVPTVKLRDNNWKEEFEKWDAIKYYDKIKRYCYASIAKVIDEDFDLVICDEIHNITENNVVFFKNNKVKRVIGLTATVPEDDIKYEIINKIAPVKFTYTLSEGVKDGVVSPYEIKVVETRLDHKNKSVKAGKKGNYYYVTERKKYENLSRLINILRYGGKDPIWATMSRMRFIYDLESKTELAKKILDQYIDKDLRTIIFCGSIKQADELCKHRYHSKTDDKDLQAFIDGKINRLSCVKALNEGLNIPNVDAALIVQANSKEKDLVQRVGRIVRLRDDHKAMIWIISVLDTQDEVWVDNALSTFENIEYINQKNL